MKPDRTVRLGPKQRRRGLTQVHAQLAGDRGYAMVVFGTARDVPRIGRHTLDSFLLDVDETGQRLVPKVFHLIQHV